MKIIENTILDLKEKINEQLATFSKISLQEIDAVALMDRVDVKYVLPLYALPQILSESKNHYKILSIENMVLAPYETLYYDFPSFNLYHLHQTGKLNRHKIRFRKYLNTGTSFVEVKFKNNKRRTIKTRIPTSLNSKHELNADSRQFLSNDIEFEIENLEPKIWVNYSRLTLINLETYERVTIDLDLTFKTDQTQKIYNKIAIVEVKQTKNMHSNITEIFRKHQIKPGSVSKYCLGIMSLFPDIKYNRFKKKFLHLKKIESQYEYFTNSH